MILKQKYSLHGKDTGSTAVQIISLRKRLRDYLHDKNLIHHDLHPGNLLVSEGIFKFYRFWLM